MKKIINLSNIALAICVLNLLSTYLIGLNSICAKNLLSIWILTNIAIPILAISLIVDAIFAIFKKKPFTRQIIIFIISLLLFLYVPSRKLFYAGAITSLKIAGESNVLNEAKDLINLNKKYLTKDTKNNEHILPEREIPEKELPIAIKRLSPLWVRVNEKEVIVKKYGLGDVAGFVIMPDGNPDGLRKVSNGIYWIEPGG